VGDVILSVNGKAVDQSIDLPRMIGEGRPGSSFRLEVWRDGKARAMEVKLGETPAEQLADAGATVRPAQLGLVVRPLDPAERERLQTRSGVVVERAAGPAAKAGIRPGDVIIALNSEPVESAEALRDILERSRDRVALLVQRKAARFFVPVPMG
jgi:serine protease Do